MAHISEDRVLETSTSTGTGTLALAGAVTGYRTFASTMAVADTCLYAVWGVDANGSPSGEWEGGVGTYSATNTLTRTTVLESSNAGSVVTLSAGTKYVAITLIAAKTGQFDNVGAMWLPAASAEPGTPATGNYLYAKQLLPGHTVVKVKRPSGVDSPLQDSIAFNRFFKVQGGVAGTTITPIGVGNFQAPTAGTVVAPTSGSNTRDQLHRSQFATAATANAINAFYTNSATNGPFLLRGSSAGKGGFRLVMRFTLSALQASNRFFAGLRDVVSVPTNVDPFTSTTPGTVGLAVNTATDANWRIVSNVSGTAPTTVALGANFPVNATDLIELVLFCRPHNGTTAGDFNYRVRRYTTTGDHDFEATGTITTNIPAAATLLYAGMWMVNVTAAVASFQLGSITIESDF